MKSSHYEISLQRDAVHILEAFLNILLLSLLLFIIVVAITWLSASPNLGKTDLYIIGERPGQKEFPSLLVEGNIVLCLHMQKMR